jgi:hypothetical protein
MACNAAHTEAFSKYPTLLMLATMQTDFPSANLGVNSKMLTCGQVWAWLGLGQRATVVCAGEIRYPRLVHSLTTHH